MVNLVSVAIFDVLVVVLTVYRTGRISFEIRKNGFKGSLSFVLLRDGLYMIFWFIRQMLPINFTQGMLYYRLVCRAIFVLRC